MVDFNYSVSGTANGGVSPFNNTSTEWPVSVMGSTGGIAKFKLADDISLNLEGSLWLGYNNQILDRSAKNQSTILRWYDDRYTVFMTRTSLSPESNIFGINELSGTLNFDSIGLSLKLAAFSQVEKLAYPYIHNTAGGFPSLQLAGFDTTSPADIYGPYIGPLAAIIYKPTFLEGLELLAQVGTAGLDAFSFKTLYETAQIKYSYSDLKMGDKDATLTGAVYYTHKDPLETVTPTGETVSPTQGVGLSVMLDIPDTLAFNFGYSFNQTDKEGTGIKIKSRFDGINVSANVPIAGVLYLGAGYSWLQFNETIDAFVDTTEKTAEHAVDFKVVVPFLENHLAVIAGYRATFVDEMNTLDPLGGDRHVVSIGLTGNLAGEL